MCCLYFLLDSFPDYFLFSCCQFCTLPDLVRVLSSLTFFSEAIDFYPVLFISVSQACFSFTLGLSPDFCEEIGQWFLYCHPTDLLSGLWNMTSCFLINCFGQEKWGWVSVSKIFWRMWSTQRYLKWLHSYFTSWQNWLSMLVYIYPFL